MDSSVSPKDEMWFLCVCHHILTQSTAESRPSDWAVMELHSCHFHVGSDVALWNVYCIQVHNVIKCWNRIAEFPGLTTGSAITAVVENGVRVEKSVVFRRSKNRGLCLQCWSFDRAPAKKRCVMQVTLIGFVMGKNSDEWILFAVQEQKQDKLPQTRRCPKLCQLF